MVRRFSIGKDCPRCGEKGRRVRTPWYLRPLRWILRHRSSTRYCPEDDIRWFSVHGRRGRGRGRHPRRARRDFDEPPA